MIGENWLLFFSFCFVFIFSSAACVCVLFFFEIWFLPLVSFEIENKAETLVCLSVNHFQIVCDVEMLTTRNWNGWWAISARKSRASAASHLIGHDNISRPELANDILWSTFWIFRWQSISRWLSLKRNDDADLFLCRMLYYLTISNVFFNNQLVYWPAWRTAYLERPK